MEKTIKYLLLLMVITGSIFTGCGSGIGEQRPDEETVEVEVIGDLETTTVIVGGDEDKEEEAETDVEVEVEAQVETEAEVEVEEPATTEATSVYADGTYTRIGAYQSPAGEEGIMVSLVVENDVVTNVSLIPQATNEKSQRYQGLFVEGAASVIVGKNLADLGNLGAVNGSSLTPIGFNNAVAGVKESAKN